MGDDVFRPDSDEAEVDRRADGWAKPRDGRGKIGALTLSNDHVLFLQQKFASTGAGGALGGLAAAVLQRRSERKAGGPQPLFALADVRAARPHAKRFGEQWEFTLADDSTCAVGGKGLRAAWEPLIRRLLEERHGLTVSDDGDGGWSVSPRA